MLPPMSENAGKPRADAAEPPHYHGHRERLRERFHGAGPEALSDYELLEMALFPALPRRDTKPLAKALLKTFGSFAEVIHAPVALRRGASARAGAEAASGLTPLGTYVTPWCAR